MKIRPHRIIAAMFVVLLLGGLAWRLIPRTDPLFRGKPENDWIAHLAYHDDEQLKQWREYGQEGVRVLIRALDHANRRWKRFYRHSYPRLTPRLPSVLARWLPAPQMDTTRQTRMRLADLLSRLGSMAESAEPAMARLLHDEDESVSQIAMGFFNSSEDEHALLNRLEPREKRRLLPEFLRLSQARNWGTRNNAFIALRYYREQAPEVVPALIPALRDPIAQVRLLAADTLRRLDPAAAKKYGAISVLIPIMQDPDGQVAYRAAECLRAFHDQPELAVPALIEGLRNTNTLVACHSIWSLEDFQESAASIVPALEKAAQRPDDVAGHARTALKHFHNATNAPAKP